MCQALLWCSLHSRLTDTRGGSQAEQAAPWHSRGNTHPVHPDVAVATPELSGSQSPFALFSCPMDRLTVRCCPKDGLRQPHNSDTAGLRDKYLSSASPPAAWNTEVGLPPSGIAGFRHSCWSKRLEMLPKSPPEAEFTLPQGALTNVLPVHVVVEGDTVILGRDVVERTDEPGFVSCHPGPGRLDEHVITCRMRGKGGQRQHAWVSLPPSDGMPDHLSSGRHGLDVPNVILARDTCRISAVPPLPWQYLGKHRRDGNLQSCCEYT